MSAWWNALPAIQQIFYTLAIPSTVLMFIQTAMLLFGFGSHDSSADHSLDHGDHGGFDHGEPDHGGLDHGAPDHEALGHDGHFDASHTEAAHSHAAGAASHEDAVDLRLFTLRGVIAFFVMTGWTGALFSTFLPVWAAVPFSLVMGFAGLYLTAKLFQWSRKLQQSGNIRWEQAVGRTAEVYIPVPAARRGSGKVTVLLQERLSEKEAVTDSRQALPTGQQVRIREVLPDGRLLVEPSRSDRQ